MSASEKWLTALRLGGFAALLAAGLYVFYLLDFDVAALFRRRTEARPWMFVLAMSLLPVAGFPIAAFYLFAGAAFSFWEAWAYCLLALSVNMSLSYLVARYLLQVPLRRFLVKRGHRLPHLSEMNQFRFVFILRTVPGPPFPVQNYLLSLIGIPFWVYLPVSLVTQGTIAAGMVACGGMLPEEFTVGHLWVAAGILGVFVAGKTIVWWRARRITVG